MGCGVSKIEETEAMILCRERSRFLAEAIGFRYSMADSHFRYLQSMRSVGESLAKFLEEIQKIPLNSGSPVLQLPAQRKGGDFGGHPELQQQSQLNNNNSSSSGHIDFHSSDSELDSDDEDEDDLDNHHLHHGDDEYDVGPTIHYAKKKPAHSESIIYEQRPVISENVVYYNNGGGEASTSSNYSNPYYGYPQNSGFNPYSNYGYASNYANSYGDMGGGGGYYGNSSPPPPNGMYQGRVAEAPKPPPPPSPPRVSAWDFLNPFENYENYYATNYTPSRSSKDVREEEGIPDLEDEENVVIKEAYKEKKVVDSSSLSTDSSKGDGGSEVEEEIPQLKRKSVEGSTSEVNVRSIEVEKNVVVSEVKESKRYNNLSEIVHELKSQFNKASDSAGELLTILEVGKQPYHQRNSVYKVSSKMICGVGTFSSLKDDLLVFEGDKDVDTLSSTLQKLYIWEKKLYDEVRSEENLRLLHDKKCREVKRLNERGADPTKQDAVLAAVRKLSTKIRVSIQIIDSISTNISKLRDNELWPQISSLIQRLMRMWNAMLECHRTQHQALLEAKNLDTAFSAGIITDAHMEVTKHLVLELLEWVANFSLWISAQKNFVGSLNYWLLNGLRYVPEVTADGVAPFSPGRLGAPPVFIICFQWAQAMERISEKEVTDAMHAFAYAVQQLWEKRNYEKRQRLMANKDMDITLRNIEREEQEMRRAVEAHNKKLALVSSNKNLAMPEQHEAGNLKDGLTHIFEAMEDFSSITLKAYEDLNSRVQEEGSTGENETIE